MRQPRQHSSTPTRKAGRALLAMLLAATLGVGSVAAATADEPDADPVETEAVDAGPSEADAAVPTEAIEGSANDADDSASSGAAVADHGTDGVGEEQDAGADDATQSRSEEEPPEDAEASRDGESAAQSEVWDLSLAADPVSGSEVEPGEPITFTLTIAAVDGPIRPGAQAEVDLSGVLAHADLAGELPAGLSLSGDQLTWSPRGAIAPSRPASVSFGIQIADDAHGVTLAATAAPVSEGGVCAACSTSHSTPAQVEPSWELSVVPSVDSGGSILTNGQVVYRMTATNTSEVPLTGASAVADVSGVLSDADVTLLREGVTYDGGNEVTWAVPDLGPGESVMSSFNVRAHTYISRGAQLDVSLTAGEFGECVAGCELVHHVVAFDVEVSADPVSGEVAPGDVITYTWRAENTAGGPLSGAHVQTWLADLVTDGELVEPLAENLRTIGTAVLRWDLPTLEPGEAVEVEFAVAVDEAAAAGAQIVTEPSTGRARHGGLVLDPGTTTHTVVALPSWDLELTSTPPSGSTMHLGGVIQYALSATNTSQVQVSGAEAVVDVSEVSPHVRWVAFTDDALAYDEEAETITWSVPDLAEGESATVTYRATTLTTGAGQNLTSTASAEGEGGQCAGECATTHHLPAWDAAMTASPDSGQVFPGDEITYTLRAQNTSDAVISGAHVRNPLAEVLAHTTLVEPLDPELSVQLTSTLNWDVPELAPGQGAEVSFTVVVDEDARGGSFGTRISSAGPARTGGSIVEPNAANHTVGEATWSLSKTADPESGSAVEPGDVITYTLTAESYGPRPATGVVATDDLSTVLEHATLVEPLPPGLSLEGDQLTWTVRGPVPVNRPASISYSVLVADDAWGETLTNTAAPAVGTGECLESCTTTHVLPAWSLAKTADPPSGESLRPSQTVTYTLTATNTSDAPVSGAQARDDVSGVSPFGILQRFTDDALAYDAEADVITWSVPDLAPGESASVTYAFRTLAGAAGQTLVNVAEPVGLGGECAAECTTAHPVSAWEATKTSTPESGSEVDPGSEITYHLQVQNTSDAQVSAALVHDNLTAVLPHAELAEPLEDGLTLTGQRLTWAVPDLAPGESAQVSYTVVVNDDAWDATLANSISFNQLGASCEACGTTHSTPEAAPWSVNSAATPGSGQTVNAGSVIEYRLTAINGRFPLTGAQALADLSGVLAHGTLVEPLATGLEFDPDTQVLTWDVPDLAPHQIGHPPVSYQVLLDADAWGVNLTHEITPGPGGECWLVCSLTHHTPAWDLDKTSAPGSGETVVRGDVVAYTLTATNTSDGVVSGALVADDLSAVAPFATILPLADGLTYDEATQRLTWSVPDLEPGESASTTYRVRVLAGTAGQSLVNAATAIGAGGQCADECTTTHPIPSWVAGTGSDPHTGTEVLPGEEITYTLRAQNTSDAVVSGARVWDQLSQVLAHATLQGPLDPALIMLDTRVIWSVPDLAPGEGAEVSYTVVVNDGAWDVTLSNRISATPPELGGSCDPCVTAHTTPAGPPWSVTMAATPGSGTEVRPGTVVNYHLGAVNGVFSLTGGQAFVDLSGFPGEIVTDSLIEEFSYDDATQVLTWHVPDLGPRQLLERRTYQVRIDAGAWDQTIHSEVTTGPGGQCWNICETVHTTPEAPQQDQDPPSYLDRVVRTVFGLVKVALAALLSWW